jgi:hypothetical protein
VEEPRGAVRVESYALTYGRNGNPKSAVVFCREKTRDRCLAEVAPEAEVVEQVAREQPIGSAGALSWDGTFHFS